jgi:hypothetical protein
MLAALALFPAAADAGAPHATVLSVDRHHHTLQLVDAGHIVHAYRYRGKLPRVGVGDQVSFRSSGRAISGVTRIARGARAVSFYAQVVRASSGKVRLRLSDGNALSVPSHTASAPPTVRIHGLTPGLTVLVSETVDAVGHWTITITLPPAASSSGAAAPGDDPSAGDQVAEGAITQVSASGLSVSTDSGPLTLSVDPASDLTVGFVIGDIVDVTYADSADGSLVADDVEYVEQDASGVVTAVSDASVTVGDQADGTAVTVTTDPGLGLFTGIAMGDAVDVTYHQSGSRLVADAVDDQSWDT